MVKHSKELTDQDFIYAYITEYLDDQLPEDQAQRFDKVLQASELDGMPSDYGICRGQLQIALQKVFLTDEEIRQLHTLVEDDAARANHEADTIEDIGRSELFGNILRLSVLSAILVAMIGTAYYFLAPPKQAAFSALDTLIYEAIVMVEEPRERLDFPTDKVDELRDYFVRYPDLGFRVRTFQSPGPAWTLVGGSVIDYEVARIVVGQFNENTSKEDLFVFLFEGQLSDLPYARQGNREGLIYQAYSSDRFNVVSWQVSRNILGMVMGYRGAEELAGLANQAVGLYEPL